MNGLHFKDTKSFASKTGKANIELFARFNNDDSAKWTSGHENYYFTLGDERMDESLGVPNITFQSGRISR